MGTFEFADTTKIVNYLSHITKIVLLIIKIVNSIVN